MFWSKNKKINVYPSKPQFYYIKVGSEAVKIILAFFRDGLPMVPRGNVNKPQQTGHIPQTKKSKTTNVFFLTELITMPESDKHNTKNKQDETRKMPCNVQPQGHTRPQRYQNGQWSKLPGRGLNRFFWHELFIIGWLVVTKQNEKKKKK